MRRDTENEAVKPVEGAQPQVEISTVPTVWILFHGRNFDSVYGTEQAAYAARTVANMHCGTEAYEIGEHEVRMDFDPLDSLPSSLAAIIREVYVRKDDSRDPVEAVDRVP